jgi:hypothetical protein
MDIKRHANGRPLSGIEIGVFRAEHANIMLNELNMERLVLVDPYVPDDPDFQGKMKSLIDGAKDIADKVLAAHNGVIEWHVMNSDKAIEYINGEFDFVYIDGNHSRDYVMRDIINYSPLVQYGGWVGGHDYMMRSSPLVEVKDVVDSWVFTKDKRLFVGEGKFPDWWYRK